MNTIKKMLCGFAAIAMFTACSSDDVDGPKGGDVKEGDFYTTLTLSVPAGRSETVDWDGSTNSEHGFEVGQNYENYVGNVIIVLAQNNGTGTTPADYTYITSNTATPVSAGTINGEIAYQVTFESQELVDHATENICVFAICNPTTALQTNPELMFEGNGNDAEGMGTGLFAEKSQFLMTNSALTTTTLPSKNDLEKTYNTEANPFNLGIVHVKRVVARFDIKEKAETAATETEIALGKNQYPIKVDAVPAVPEQAARQEPLLDSEGQPVLDKDGKPIMLTYPVVPAQPAIPAHTAGYVEIDGMAAFNTANDFYYLPRVGDASFSNIITCGTETPSNWVVSPYYTQKSAANLDLNWIRTAYSANMLGTDNISFVPTQLTFTTMASLASNDEDDDNNWGLDESKTGIPGYRIWRYVNENTIPGANNQRHGITTGVCFSAHLAAVETEGVDDPLTNLIKDGTKVLYSFGNDLIGDMAMLREKVNANSTSALAVAYRAALALELANNPDFKEGVDDFSATTANGLKILRPTAGQYKMYYYYYNRHNDNGLPTEMGNMEFATVRNNVYKLYVEKINRFGHTGQPGDDPEPEKPDTPDEEAKTYFRVQVHVLPWVVRINNIEF